jgi:hypothetical protein
VNGYHCVDPRFDTSFSYDYSGLQFSETAFSDQLFSITYDSGVVLTERKLQTDAFSSTYVSGADFSDVFSTDVSYSGSIDISTDAWSFDWSTQGSGSVEWIGSADYSYSYDFSFDASFDIPSIQLIDSFEQIGMFTCRL